MACSRTIDLRSKHRTSMRPSHSTNWQCHALVMCPVASVRTCALEEEGSWAGCDGGMGSN
eukprot:1146273-Pelagomonas_calceolata.AAC.1